MCCGSTSRNNVNVISFLGVAHNEQLSRTGLAHREQTFFTHGVIGIWNCHSKWIAEYGACLFECDLVVSLIPSILIRVPRKPHRMARIS
jgi:hypothetical protein